MKTSIWVVLFLTTFTAIDAQETRSKAARNFENFHYIDAAKAYERKVRKGDNTQETLKRLGDTYYNNSDMDNAAKWYGQLFSTYERTLSLEYIFKYIHSLKGIGNYELAKALMKIYAAKADREHFNVSHFMDNDLALDKLRSRQPQFAISHLSFNSPYADFGPMYFLDKIVFASSRDSMNLHSRVYEWNEQPYLNLYEADTVQLGSALVDVREFDKDINTKYHEAMTTFNQDGTVMYFTRNNYTDKNLERDGEGINHLKIYKSKLHDGDWTPPKEVPFNSNDYSVGQPALSPDGKRLYFVSDMSQGFGGPDLYYVELHGDGEYSEPINLGKNINTSGREMFPFVTKEKLYFASDGHLGFGGLDVFESKHGDTPSVPFNLGPVLNSRFDDFSFIINEQTNRGYFSSNREGGSGDDDIYSFHRLEQKCGETVKGTVAQKTNNKAITDAQVQLINPDGSILAKSTTDTHGSFSFDTPLDCDMTYQIKVSKEGYNEVSEDFAATAKLGKPNVVSLFMSRELNELIINENGVLKIKIGNINFNLNKASIRPDAAKELDKIVEVMKEYPAMIIKIESHSDSRGSDSYNESLSDRRAKFTKNYIITQGIEKNRIESAIGYGEKQILNRCVNDVWCSDKDHGTNRRSEFIIVQLE